MGFFEHFIGFSLSNVRRIKVFLKYDEGHFFIKWQPLLMNDKEFIKKYNVPRPRYPTVPFWMKKELKTYKCAELIIEN